MNTTDTAAPKDIAQLSLDWVEMAKKALKTEPSAADGYYNGYHDALATTPQTDGATVAMTDWHHQCATLIDIYDDGMNNAPEDRCYIEGTWKEVVDETRALLAATHAPAMAETNEARYQWLRHRAVMVDYSDETVTKLTLFKAEGPTGEFLDDWIDGEIAAASGGEQES